MKRVNLLLSFLLIGIFSQAQTVDEVISEYIAVKGGKEKLESLRGLKMGFSQNMQGMQFAGDIYALKDGYSMLHINVQGNDLYQNVYDGKNMWGTNFMTMKAEKVDAESLHNYKVNEAKDFPDPLLNYESKGYKAELVGTEDIEGSECYKIKLTKNPIMQSGVEKEKIDFYFIDKENHLMVASETEMDMGMGAQIVRSLHGDFNEVEGLVFPFSLVQEVNGQKLTTTMTSIELNPEVDMADFAFPTE